MKKVVETEPQTTATVQEAIEADFVGVENSYGLRFAFVHKGFGHNKQYFSLRANDNELYAEEPTSKEALIKKHLTGFNVYVFDSMPEMLIWLAASK